MSDDEKALAKRESHASACSSENCRLWPPLLDRLANRALSPNDSLETKMRKKYFFVVVIISMVVTLVTLPAHLQKAGWFGDLHRIGMAILLVIVMVVMLVLRRLPMMAIHITIFASCYMVALMVVTSNGEPTLLLSYVIIVDVLLVLRMPRYATMAVVSCSLLVTILTYAESAFRLLGLFEAAGSPDKTQYYQTRYCSCGKPPCGNGDLYEEFATPVANCSYVLILDFVLTRMFAEGVETERAKVTASIEAANAIAERLARFDLEAAEEMLEARGSGVAGMPSGVRRALSQLLHNLRCYRPYIPNALFDELHELHDKMSTGTPSSQQSAGDNLSFSCSPRTRQAPGAVNGVAAIVFTDIVGSTTLWEQAPQVMSKSLKLHNTVIRDAIEQHDGYEVKTIGDAFMVAFPGAARGLAFGLSVQEALLHAAWPAELLTLPACCVDSKGIWGGLAIRIGVCCGEVDVVVNVLTARADYFGTTVNTAARMEAACPQGGVCASKELMEEVVAEADGIDLVAVNMGSVKLKGLAEEVELQASYRPALASRWETRDHRSNAAVPLTKEPTSGTRTGLSMRRTPGPCTVATVEMQVPPTGGRSFAWNTHVSFLLTCVTRGHGKVLALAGQSMCVSWNATAPCPTHVENSLRFAGLVGGAADSSDGMFFTLGVCTTEAVYGTVGNAEQRFLNVFGEGVGMCRRLAEEAHSIGKVCLYSNVTTLKVSPLVSRFFFPLLTWGTDAATTGYRRHAVAVVDLQDLVRRGVTSWAADEVPPEAGGSDAYSRLTPHGTGTVSRRCSAQSSGGGSLLQSVHGSTASLATLARGRRERLLAERSDQNERRESEGQTSVSIVTDGSFRGL